MPTARRILSGVASALFIARRIQAGLAANIRPSSTNRIPTPMRKSANAMDLIGWQPPVCCYYRWAGEAARASPCLALLRLRRGRRRGPRTAGRAAEISEEFGVGPQQEPGVAALQPVFIRRHRAIEGEEIRILAVGLGEQPVALGIA